MLTHALDVVSSEDNPRAQDEKKCLDGARHALVVMCVGEHVVVHALEVFEGVDALDFTIKIQLIDFR